MSSPYRLVTRDRHSGRFWRRNADYRFAARANVAVLAADELAPASSAFPLAFITHEERLSLVAVFSLQPGHNSFVDADGGWRERYVPAGLRGHPFRLTHAGDDEVALCVDRAAELDAPAGRGAIPFFDAGGNPHPEITRMLQFLHLVEKGIERLKRPVELLQAQGLLEPWSVKGGEGARSRRIDGMLRVNETALNAVTQEQLVALRDAGALPVAYAQLISMHHLPRLRQLASLKPSQDAGASELEGFFLHEQGRIRFT